MVDELDGVLPDADQPVIEDVLDVSSQSEVEIYLPTKEDFEEMAQAFSEMDARNPQPDMDIDF